MVKRSQAIHAIIQPLKQCSAVNACPLKAYFVTKECEILPTYDNSTNGAKHKHITHSHFRIICSHIGHSKHHGLLVNTLDCQSSGQGFNYLPRGETCLEISVPFLPLAHLAINYCKWD